MKILQRTQASHRKLSIVSLLILLSSGIKTVLLVLQHCDSLLRYEILIIPECIKPAQHYFGGAIISMKRGFEPLQPSRLLFVSTSSFYLTFNSQKSQVSRIFHFEGTLNSWLSLSLSSYKRVRSTARRDTTVIQIKSAI